MMYVTLVLSSFGTYYIPTLSQTANPEARIQLIRQLLRLSIILMTPAVASVTVLKPLVINTLYSSEFVDSLNVMRWMLVGDYFKVTSWILAAPILAFADMKTFLRVELAWNTGFLFLCALAVLGLNWLPGVGVAFLLLYIGNFLYALFYTCRRHHFTFQQGPCVQWLVGLMIVAGASASTWNDRQMQWPIALMWITISGLFSLLSFRSNERQRLLSAISSRLQRYKYV
jgi:O-antigen/teichoic acid export membrane protein